MDINVLEDTQTSEENSCVIKLSSSCEYRTSAIFKLFYLTSSLITYAAFNYAEFGIFILTSNYRTLN